MEKVVHSMVCWYLKIYLPLILIKRRKDSVASSDAEAVNFMEAEEI